MANVQKETTATRNVAVLFGKGGRDARVAARLTMKQAAKKARVGIDFLRGVEHGEKHLPFEAIMRLADACKVKPAAFWRSSEPQPAEEWRHMISKWLDGCSVEQLRKFFRVLIELRIEDRDKR